MEIRRIRADEWETFKSLRLAALRRDGRQFGQTLEELGRYSDERWQADTLKAANSDELFILLAFEGLRAVGMSGCIRRGDFGKIFAVWVEPEHRGKGVGRSLVQATMALVAAGRYKLSVVEDNIAARHIYESLGFATTGFGYVNLNGLREVEMTKG